MSAPSSIESLDSKAAIAFHEAGHATLALLLGYDSKAWVEIGKDLRGEWHGLRGECGIDWRGEHNRVQWPVMAAIYMAGVAGDILASEERWKAWRRAGGDMKILRDLWRKEGVGFEEIDRRIARGFQIAMTTLEKSGNREMWQELARRLRDGATAVETEKEKALIAAGDM